MTADRRARASDQDRENAVDVLSDAYAAGRLGPEEFYQRLDAAYAAMTLGELDSMTADLPTVWTDAGLPSNLAASRGNSRPVGWCLLHQAILVFLLVVAAGLAGRVSFSAVWAICALVPFALLLPFTLGRRRDAAVRRRGGRHGAAQHDRELRDR
jgi:hypothetical protein